MNGQGNGDGTNAAEPSIVCQHSAQTALFTRLRVPVSKLGASLADALERLLAQLEAQDLSIAGGPFLAVHELSATDVDLELGLPVFGAGSDGHNVRAGTIPAGRYLTFVHRTQGQPLIEEFRSMQVWLHKHTERTHGPLYALISRERVPPAGEHVTLLQRRISAGGAAAHTHDLMTDALPDRVWIALTEAVVELARLCERVQPFAPSQPSPAPEVPPAAEDALPVKEAMSPDVVSCRASDTAQRAAQLMWEHDVGALPVVDDADRPIAMVTDRDLCMASYTQGKALWEIAVRSAMSQRIHVCRPEHSVEYAECLMASHQIRRLPVVDAHGTLIGVLSMNDVALARSVAARPPSDASSSGVSATLAAISQHRTIRGAA